MEEEHPNSLKEDCTGVHMYVFRDAVLVAVVVVVVLLFLLFSFLLLLPSSVPSSSSASGSLLPSLPPLDMACS